MDRRTLLKMTGYAGLAAAWTTTGCAAAPADNLAPETANQTQWTVAPSIGLDACFALTIAGAPETVMQVEHHLAHRAVLRDRLGPDGVEAAETLMFALAQAGREATPGPGLAYVVSAGSMQTLDGVISAMVEDGVLAAGLADDPEYANPRAQANINRVRPIAEAAFRALQTAGYEQLWQAESAPKLNAAAAALRAELTEVDVITQHRRYLSRAFDPSVTLYISELSEPHGIKITGQRFITSPNYSTMLIRRIATHEMMHRLLDPERDETARILARLSDDPLMRSVLANADKAYGYTGNPDSVRGLVEEGGVQALEAVINENLDQARDQGAYWRHQDGGMHIFAAATYARMHATGFAETGGDFLAWLDQQTADGSLLGAGLDAAAMSVVGDATVQTWRPAR